MKYKETYDTLSLDEIENILDSYYKELDIKELHLKDIVKYQSYDLDRILDILKEPGMTDFSYESYKKNTPIKDT